MVFSDVLIRIFFPICFLPNSILFYAHVFMMWFYLSNYFSMVLFGDLIESVRVWQYTCAVWGVWDWLFLDSCGQECEGWLVVSECEGYAVPDGGGGGVCACVSSGRCWRLACLCVLLFSLIDICIGYWNCFKGILWCYILFLSFKTFVWFLCTYISIEVFKRLFFII